jgi:fibronectin-binding autotransporter adhesin
MARRSYSFAALGIFALLIGSSRLATAATETWSGAVTTDWNVAGNWLENAIPATGDSLVFDASSAQPTSNNNIGSLSLAGLTFASGAPGYALTGNAVSMTGPLVVNAGNSIAQTIGFGVTSTGALSFGTDNSGGNSLSLGANSSFGSLTVLSTSATANNLDIGTGQSVTINGAVAFGLNTDTITTGVFTNLNTSGGGSLVINSGTNFFRVGIERSNTPAGDPQTTVDLSGLSNFTFTGTGTTTGHFRVGAGNSRGTMTLANTSNKITAAQVRIGDSGVDAGTTGGSNNNNGGVGTLRLGAGTNEINTNELLIGRVKNGGTLNFATTTGSLLLRGFTGEGSLVNITVGSADNGSHASASQLLLAGHDVTVNAGTLLAGRSNGGSGNGNGSVTFDTGTFNVQNVHLGVHLSGSATASGTLTIGGPTPDNTAATGVFNVSDQFFLGNRTNATAANPVATATFTINGGTANINTDVVDASTTTSSVGSNATKLTLAGGTLNMMNHSVGTAARPIQTIELNSGTLSNAVNIVGKNITVQPTVTINGAPTFVVADGGSLSANVFPLTLGSGGGIAGGSEVGPASVNGDIVLNSGARIAPGLGSAVGTLQFNSPLTLNGGSIVQIDLSNSTTSGNDLVNAFGGLTLNGTVNIQIGTAGQGPQLGNTYTLFNTGALVGTEANLNVTGNGSRLTFTPVPVSTTPGTIQVLVGGSGPVAVTWIGNVDSNWDLNATQNWRNPALNPEKFFNLDQVTFDDTSTNVNDVQLVGTLSPGSVTVNAARNYTFAGSGTIAGSGNLTKNGFGTLTLVANNTYSGTTDILGGTLQIGNGGTTGSVGAGQVNNDGMLAINRSNNVTFANVIAGTGSLVKNGSGQLAVTGVNSFSGPTSINAGMLQVNSSYSLGGAVSLTGAVTNGSNLVTGLSSTGGLTVGMPISGTGIPAGAVITVVDPDALTVTLSANANGAGTSFTVGTNTSPINIASGATLELGAGAAANSLVIGARQVNIAGAGVGGNGAIINSSTTAAQQNSLQRVTLTADATVGGAGRFDLRHNSPVLDLATNTLTKVGTGQFILVGANVTDGNILVHNGVFSIESTSSVLANPARPQDKITFDSTVIPGAAVTAQFFASATASPTITRPMLMRGPITMGNNSNAAVTVGSNIELQGDLTVTNINNNGTGSLTLNGVISETGGVRSLTKNNGPGTSNSTLILGGNNTYTGTTTINGGTLQLGAANRIADVSNLVLGGGTFNTGGFNETLGTLSLSSASTIDLGSGASELRFAASNIAAAWNLTNLTISNWTPGSDHIFFGSSDAGLGTITATEANQIIFAGRTPGFRILGTGEVIPALPGTIVAGDFNLDGSLSPADIQPMLKALTDVEAYKSAYALTQPQFDTITDLDSNPNFSNRDIQNLLDRLATANLGSVAAVPEPTSFVHGAMALVGVAVTLRRRKQRS